jgi:glycosyltransferase involved in cell wall biosynthesis
MARAAQDAGFEVHVAARYVDGEARVRAEGFVPHPIKFSRGSLSPVSLISTAGELRRLIRELRPAILHNIAVKPILVGSLAALATPELAVVNSLTGRGALFVDDSRASRLSRPLVSRLLGWLLRHGRNVAVVQNPDDGALLQGFGVPSDRIVLIAGSGVETDHFTPLPEPPPPITAAYVGRMLNIKGVPNLIDAFAKLRQRGVKLRLLLAGRCDPENPGSLAPEQLKEFASLFGIQWIGHVDDVREVWKEAHFAVLASRGGEGLPKTLLEAAACGRAMIATDVPGSREIAIEDETGLLVPPDDVDALADAMQRLATDPALRLKLAANARALVEQKFSADAIGKQIAALYSSLLKQKAG